MKKLRAWLRAARLGSQSYIALPLVLGQLLAWRQTGEWSWGVFVLVQLFGLFDQLYIVFANDVADVETDRHNETATPFSGGSRVLVDGSLTPASLRRAAIAMAVLCLGIGMALLTGWSRPWPLALIIVGLALLWAYSFGPIRLSYRGGGELLQMLGVGAVLPLIGWTAQGAAPGAFPWALFGALLPLSLATAICTALPDVPSDRASSKRTWPVLVGSKVARGSVVVLNALGLAAFWLAAHGATPGLDVAPLPLTAVSIGATVALLPIAPGARPGSTRILAFVVVGALANLALGTALIVDLFPGG